VAEAKSVQLLQILQKYAAKQDYILFCQLGQGLGINEFKNYDLCLFVFTPVNYSSR
jgi:hypothetical protein